MSIKRLVALLLVLVICSMSLVSFAQGKEQSQLDVYHINNEGPKLDLYLDGKDLSHYTGLSGSLNFYSIVKGNTFMQLKRLGDALNVTLYWNQDTREVSFDSNGKSVVIKIGSKIAKIDNEEMVLNVAPFIKDGRTFVPLRFVSESLGINVNYIDIRPEAEFAKRAILDFYPSMENLIISAKNNQGNKYVYPRLRVVNYNTQSHVMQIIFEDGKYGSDSNSQWFGANIKDRTIDRLDTRKTIIDWYEKEIEENN